MYNLSVHSHLRISGESPAKSLRNMILYIIFITCQLEAIRSAGDAALKSPVILFNPLHPVDEPLSDSNRRVNRLSACCPGVHALPSDWFCVQFNSSCSQCVVLVIVLACVECFAVPAGYCS